MMQNDDVPAIPLWIAGRAHLTLAPQFTDVRAARAGQVLRRTPSCGASQAHLAVVAARDALPGWATPGAAGRADLLAVLGDALAGYADHFARLIEEECGDDAASATAEVSEAVALLRGELPAGASGDANPVQAGVLAIVGKARAPLSALLRVAVPAWLAGATLVVLPAAQAPSAVFALAELSARCAFPAGVFNVLYGDVAVLGGVLADTQPLRHA